MKKTLILVMILVLVTGCKSSNKKLTCKFVDSNNSQSISKTYTFVFDRKGDNLKKYEIEEIRKYSEFYLNALQSNNQTLESSTNKDALCSPYGIHKGISCKVDIKDNEIIIKVKGVKNENNKEYFGGSYKSRKEQYETLNYQCS